MALVALPARLSSTRLELDRLNAEVNKFTVDTINHLKSLRLQVQADDAVIQAELDALEASLTTAPSSVIGTAAPSRGIGGGNSLGAGPLLARSNHDHTIRETSGPADLTVGGILLGDFVSRQAGGLLAGKQIMGNRQTGAATTSSTTLADVASSMNFTLLANSAYLAFWVVHYNTAATTTGLRLSVNYTGTTAALRYGIIGATSLTGFQSETATAVDTALGQAGVGPGGTNRIQLMFCTINTTTAGDLALRYASGVAASNVTISANSSGFIFQR